MSRVWKQFFKNLAWPFGAATYLLFVTGGSQWLNHTYGDTIAFLFFVITFVIPIFAYVVREMWRDAKEKIERENEEMMRTLKGKDDWSGLYEK